MISLLPAFLPVALRDLRGETHPVGAPESHLNAAVDWLVRAQDATPDGGVSYGYSLKGGWRPSYVETTGYIAPTFFELAAALGRPGLRERAVRMADWLCSVQRSDGSFGNERLAPGSGIVFDTGQVIFGLTRAHQETADPRFSTAVDRAGRWLVEQATNESGRWTRHTHLGIPHVYNTRTAWALLQANQTRDNPAWERVGRANLDWALSQMRGPWFERCAFESGVPHFTHTIAYAIRGLWESGLLLSEPGYLEAAERAALAVAEAVRDDGFLPGRIDTSGRASARYCCMTGNCQMAVNWARIFSRTSNEPCRRAAVGALRYVIATQDLTTSNLDVRGAIKGSQPIWGAYARFTYPNWATKFFVDALVHCGAWLP